MSKDWYRGMLSHFKWTWLEHKACRFIKPPRVKDRTATKLARAFAKRETRREIEAGS